MEGLDTLIMRKKQSSKSSSLESNGSSSNQTSPASQWFSSKSSKKIYYPVIPLLFSLMWIFLVKKYLHFVVYSCLQNRSKWFRELPWEESLRDAHEFGKLVLF
ncbi:uncharacterized protein LOC105788365 [Gossypium raimondii]|uniref:uncharacterized protein LOC105788365 n=1 Tax=Gossypium raimondii TaxID=29730 RepID=UPI00227A3CEC|nr:uncharacterized protein LOC105788365 [Gossypium raimondii]